MDSHRSSNGAHDLDIFEHRAGSLSSLDRLRRYLWEPDSTKSLVLRLSNFRKSVMVPRLPESKLPPDTRKNPEQKLSECMPLGHTITKSRLLVVKPSITLKSDKNSQSATLNTELSSL